jgi:hypothetical protein
MKKFIVFSLLLSAAPLFAQNATTTVADTKSVPVSNIPGSSISIATEKLATSTKVAAPPVLDGKTDDEAWKNAQVIDKFLEYDPKVGAETRFKTEVRVVHDEKFLYVLARMYDPAPDSIVSLDCPRLLD